MNKSNKEIRLEALHMAMSQLRAKFDHLANAVVNSHENASETYLELTAHHFPNEEDVLLAAEKYIQFLDKAE